MKTNKIIKKVKPLSKTVKVVLIAFVMTAITLTTTGCGGDDNPIASATGCGSWANEMESATNKYLDAATNYANDPTSTNCKTYKDAGLNYVKVYKNLTKCIPSTSKTFYEQALNTLKDEINSLDCN